MFIKRIFIIVWIGCSFFAGSAAFGQDQGIHVSEENPRYWQYNGETMMLLGGTDTDALFQWSNEKLVGQLDTLLASGGNYVRNVMADRGVMIHLEQQRSDTRDNDVFAFHQITEGPDSGLYDLDQWNEEYWERFRRMLDETAQRDIIVQLELWDRHDFSTGVPTRRGWSEHPWNPKNNINYTAEETILEEVGLSRTGDLPFFRTIPALDGDPVVLAYQEKFISRVMSMALEYDHVLYVTSNEAHEPVEWARHWSQFMLKKANSMGKNIYRSPMQDNVHETLEEVLNFPEHYEFIEANFGPHARSDEAAEELKQRQANMLRDIWVSLSEHPLPMTQIKASTSHWGFDELLERSWRGVFSGTSSMRFHRPARGAGLTDRGQKHIAALRKITDMIEPWNAQPHHQLEDLLSGRTINEAYLMADPGRIYALYMTHDAQFPNPYADYQVGLDISAIEGEALIRWYDIENATWGETFTTSDDIVTLNRPGEVHWVAVVTPIP